MIKNMKKNLFPLLSTKSLVLGVTASIFLSSCSITNGAYTETDGIYYDPKTDVIPSNNYFENEDNRIDNIYNYEGQGLISNNKKNIIEAENRFRNTNNTQNKYSDWGGYAGSETNFYNNYFGLYDSPFIWDFSYGWGGYRPGLYSNWNFGLGYYWGSPFSYYDYYRPWGYSYFYEPYYGFYNGFYNNFYSPFYGYSPYYYGYRNYYGSPYYYGTTTYRPSTYRPRGANSSNYTNNEYRANRNNNYRNSQINEYGQPIRSGTVRDYYNQNTPSSSTSSYPNSYNGGFRTGSSSDGGFRTGNLGGFNTGGRTGGDGGFRTGR